MTPIPLISHGAAGRVLNGWLAMLGRSPVHWCDREPRDHYVYFAACSSAIKVGWSRDPVTRLKNIGCDYGKRSSSSPYVLVADCAFPDEQTFVNALDPYRAFGREWLASCSPVLALVHGLVAAAEASFFRSRHGREVCDSCLNYPHKRRAA
jgi:hypothetical protein